MATDQPHEPTARELAAQAAVQGAGLLGEELRLAKTELMAQVRQAGAGAVLLGAAGLMGLTAWLLLMATCTAAIAVVLPPWAACLIMFGGLGLTGGVLALLASKRLRRAKPPLPLTSESVRRDVEVLRERTAR